MMTVEIALLQATEWTTLGRIGSSDMNGEQEQSMKLEDLQANAAVRGILSDGLVTVVSVQWFGSEALELTYKTPTGKVANELLYRHDEPRIEIVEVGRPWSFDGDGALFRLVSRGAADPPGASLRPGARRAHLGRRAIAPSDHRGLRIHAAPSTPSLSSRR